MGVSFICVGVRQQYGCFDTHTFLQFFTYDPNWGPADLLGDTKTGWGLADLLGAAQTDKQSLSPTGPRSSTWTPQTYWEMLRPAGAPHTSWAPQSYHESFGPTEAPHTN